MLMVLRIRFFWPIVGLEVGARRCVLSQCRIFFGLSTSLNVTIMINMSIPTRNWSTKGKVYMKTTNDWNFVMDAIKTFHRLSF